MICVGCPCSATNTVPCCIEYSISGTTSPRTMRATWPWLEALGTSLLTADAPLHAATNTHTDVVAHLIEPS